MSKIIYTECDEAPMLATFSLLPVIQRFAKPMGIEVEKRDISVAGRLIAHFPERLSPEQRIPDELAALGELAKTPEGNIIKLPNISASIPQLIECIAELQAKGYNVPDYPASPKNAKPMGIEVEKRDISVSGRLIAHFPERLTPEQRIPDELSALGELAKTPEGNIIKLPNVSASIPQLLECIAELQAKGYNIPDYPANPKNAEEEAIKAVYAKVLGSAVNPVLREGNSDRRAAPPVKENAKKITKRSPAMRPWKENAARTCVSSMDDKDFFSAEQSHIMK